MALTEQEELELLELEELEAAAGAAQRPSAASEIKAKHAKNVAAGAKAYKPSWTESFQTGYKQGGSAMGLANVVGEAVKGAGEAIISAPETIRGIASGVKQMGSELVDPAAYKSVAENPIVDLPGKIGAGLITEATEPLISPRTTGKALTEAAVPVGAAKGIAAGAKAAGPAAAYTARRLVSSVVKPSLRDQAFTKDPTGAVLKHRIIGNNLDDFSENIQGTIDNLSSQVDQKIAGSNVQTPVARINSILDKDALRIADQIGISNEASLRSFIDQTKNKIIQRYGEQGVLNPQQVHALRREIDNTIIKFTPDAVEQGINKTRYEFRSGLNNIIEEAAPGVKALNHDVSSLLSAKEALGRRLATAQNTNFAGPIDIAGEVVGTTMGAPLAYSAARLGSKALGSTAVKTRAARALGGGKASREIAQKKAAPVPAPTPVPDMPQQQPQGVPQAPSQNPLVPELVDIWERPAPPEQITLGDLTQLPPEFPLARSRPGERGSIRFGGPENPEANAFSPVQEEIPRWQQRLNERRASPEYHAQLSAIGLTPDEIRIHTTPMSQLNEVEQAVKKEVRHRVIQSGLADVDRSVSNLVEGTTNEAVKFNSALRQLEEKRRKP